MQFDPNAATARYIDSLGPAALQKAHDYTVGGEWMLLWAFLVAALVTWIIIRSGVLDRVQNGIRERRKNLRAFTVSLVFLLMTFVLTLPWTIYDSWWRERSYGRTSQPFMDWFGQQLIALAVSTIITAILLIGVYWLIRKAGKWWWL